MGLLTLGDLAGLGQDGVAYAAAPPTQSYGPGPGGPARQYVMPGSRPPRFASTAARVAPQTAARARAVAPARNEAARSQVAALRAQAQLRAQSHAAALRAHQDAVRAAQRAQRARTTTRRRVRVRPKPKRKPAKPTRRARIQSLSWTAPISSYPWDLRPVPSESASEWAKREYFALRRGFSRGGETYASRQAKRKREASEQANVRDTLVQTWARPEDLRVYRSLSEKARKAAFEAGAPAWIVRDVRSGRSAGGIAFSKWLRGS
jgi:hypothetical protein